MNAKLGIDRHLDLLYSETIEKRYLVRNFCFRLNRFQRDESANYATYFPPGRD
jgi:hypothetical protein